MIRRSFWKCPTLDMPLTDEEGGSFEERFNETSRYEVAKEREANLIGSLLAGSSVSGSQLHAPVLDIDLPCKLVESTTPGHFHLYIDKVISWPQYEKLLLALEEAGIVEPGYVSASVARRQTFVRKPGVVKQPDAPPSGRGWRA